MTPLSQSKLYTFIDTSCLRGRDPALVARQLCDGGSDLIQLRAKDLPADAVKKMAEAVLPVVRAAGVPLVINDHWEVACQLGVEYCHMGQEDFFDSGYTSVSQAPGPVKRPLIGLSTHSPDDARRAVAAEPAYLGVGPVFPTTTKPQAHPVTLDYVRWAAKNVTIPWFAIGGINPGNLDQVLEAGARGICIVSAILNAPDIAKACSQIKARLR